MHSKKNILIIILIVIIILLGVILGYLIYERNMIKDNSIDNSSSNQKNSNSNNNDVSIIVEENPESYDDYLEKYIVKEFKINNIDIKNKLNDTILNTYDYSEEKDFVIFTYSTGGTCGYDDYTIQIFDYDGNLIFNNNELENDVDKLVYNGYYSFDDKKLTLGYHLSCDMDCNVCEFFYDENYEKNSNICNYKEITSKLNLQFNYLGNREFDYGVKLNTTKINIDDTYKELFKNC